MPFVLQRSPPYCLHRRSLKLGSAPTMSTNSKARAPVNHFFTKHLSAFKMSRMTAPSRQYAICLVGNRHTSVHFHLIDSDSGHKCLAGLWGSPCGGEPWSPWRTNSASNTLASFTSIRRIPDSLHDPPDGSSRDTFRPQRIRRRNEHADQP